MDSIERERESKLYITHISMKGKHYNAHNLGFKFSEILLLFINKCHVPLIKSTHLKI